MIHAKSFRILSLGLQAILLPALLSVQVQALITPNIAQADAGAKWTYSGKAGPEHWANLSPEFTACSGKNQSPIDLKGAINADLPAIVFDYHSGAQEFINNGHSVQVNYNPGSKITVDGVDFELKQFHFHAPSENHIAGRSFPIEAHLVHSDKEGNLAVVAVMFEKGAASETLTSLWLQMPMAVGDRNVITASPAKQVSASSLLPSKRDYYRFNGSLTTPPCTEGVRWLVMRDSVTASEEQIKKLVTVLGHPNNRPIQALNARVVLQ